MSVNSVSPKPMVWPPTQAYGSPWVDAGLRWLGRQRWIRYGLRDRLIRRWCDPARLPDHDFEAPFAGYVYTGKLSRWIDWLVYYFGGYELDELEMLERVMHDRPDGVALDIGANVGHHALYMASFCAQVHAFEPFDPVGDRIQEKIERNGLSKISLHRVGLSDADDELPYFAPVGSNVGNGTFVESLSPSGQAEPTCTLSLRQADRYLEALNLPRVDLIKIDVEGFEMHVLAGLKQSLRRYRPVLMLELSDTARQAIGSFDDFLAMLPPDYAVEQIVRPHAFGYFFSTLSTRLVRLDWSAVPTRGGYVNLLLRPRH